eukprot:684832-Heterocapsa_arctica.AAC.1
MGGMGGMGPQMRGMADMMGKGGPTNDMKDGTTGKMDGKVPPQMAQMMAKKGYMMGGMTEQMGGKGGPMGVMKGGPMGGMLGGMMGSFRTCS